MKLALWKACLLCLSLLACRGQETHNVNARYTIESVQIVPSDGHLSASLRKDLDRIVGSKMDPVLLASISGRIRRELNARMVIHRISRGAQPEHVRVVFEIVRRPSLDISATRLAYHSNQGLSGALEATLRRGTDALSVGVVSDSDELVERYTGYRVRYDRRELGTSRLGFRVDVENYHDQWDANTQRAAVRSDSSGLYRNRLNIQPVVSFRVARDFTVSTGVSLERFEPEFTAARAEASNAVVNTLRYRRDWEASDASQTLDAAYSLRAATRSLDSDYVYARHLVSARYDWGSGRRHVRVVSMAGSITGQAPLYDRFSLGSGTTLRGWSKYDLEPLGGSRMAYGSVEYRYRMLHTFYDTGAVWNRGASPDVKHSIGGGVHTGNLYFSAGFPLRAGRVTPVFLMAMTF